MVISALPDTHLGTHTRSDMAVLCHVRFADRSRQTDLAVALPGLPWITLHRLTSFPLLLILLICVSIPAEFRSELGQSLRAIPAIPILLCVFVVIQLYFNRPFPPEISNSIQKFIVAQTTWTAMYFASAYIFLRPESNQALGHSCLWAMGLFVSLIAIWEFLIGHLPWRDHIPDFLKIQDETVQRILAGSMRAGTTRYRSQATFSTPLGLAEYIALTLPFVLHFARACFSQRIRLAAICSVPLLLLGCYLTDAKLRMVGCLLGILLYLFAAALQNWRQNKESLVAASILFSYPAGLGLVFAALIFLHRLQVIVFGSDGSHANSTNARIEQYTIGLQKFLEQPFGYGIGMAGATLGFGRDLGGMITIDTYYLSVLLEYGVAGFIVYYGMFAIAIYEGGKRGVLKVSQIEDKNFLLPIVISLIVFVIIKSVFSQQDNHPVIFMMLRSVDGARYFAAESSCGQRRERSRSSPPKSESVATCGEN